MPYLRLRGLSVGGGIVAAVMFVVGCHSVADLGAPSAEATVVPITDTMTDLRDRQVDALTTFTSPSGNVGCILDATMARCDIAERNWAPPLRPADCNLGYGQGITLSPGRLAQFVCAGDTTLGDAGELAYGDSITAGGLRCESSASGIACREIATGHGFSIAREAYHLF